MASLLFRALVLLSVFQQPRMVGDELDEATRERMRQRAEYMSQQMARLLQELEQSSQEQRGVAQERQLLFAALWDWRLWLMAGVLGLLLGLSCWRGKSWWETKRSSGFEESSSRHTEQEDEEEQEESEGEAPTDERDLGRIYARHIQWPVQKLAFRSQRVMELVSNLLDVFQGALSKPFSPVLQPAIGVGSAFEGWSPCHDEDVVYRLLVPLKPPLGHAFHLELGTTGGMPAEDARVRVEPVCTCTTGSPGEDTLCFLHIPKKSLTSNEAATFLGTLCTSSYLDVQKTAHWFQSNAKSAWLLLPQSRRYDMKVLPSSRSCKLQLTNASKRTLVVELLFGVQQGDSDIFLSSQAPEAAFTPSTTWPQSYAVAEAKFFRHMTSQAPRGRFPLKCLCLCTGILVGTGFSTSALKTIVMHLLITTPLSGWCAKDFLLRLDDIMRYLRQCLETKCLNHFFIGNENMPKEITLPPDLQTAEPVNLFQHLAQDPAAHNEALHQFVELQDRLARLLFYGI